MSYGPTSSRLSHWRNAIVHGAWLVTAALGVCGLAAMWLGRTSTSGTDNAVNWRDLDEVPTAATAGGADDPGVAREPIDATNNGMDNRPSSGFAFEVVRKFDPPPGDGFWTPIDIKLGAGRVWIVDYRAGRVYVYWPDGRYERTIGRPGQGPGELKGPFTLGIVADTLWVLNNGNSRIEYFGLDGRFLGVQRFPHGIQALFHLEAVGGDFIGTTIVPFDTMPLLRFPRTLDGARASDIEVRRFGGELFARARKLEGTAMNVPQAYRIYRMGDQFWVLHTYLPLVGIYDTTGTPLRIIEYPGPQIGSGRMQEERDAGELQRTVSGPQPVGGGGLLPGPYHTVYLLTQQKQGGAQIIYQIAPDGRMVSKITNPLSSLMAFAASQRHASYVLGQRKDTGEVEAYILRRTQQP